MEKLIEEKSPRQINFSNAQTVALCHRNRELAGIINGADLNMADGMSIVWGARFLGLKMPERVAGPDVMRALCQRAAAKGHRIFLMGSSVANLEKLSRALEANAPGLHIAGTYSPPWCERFSEEETQIIISHLKASQPDILFVGVSCPKQERWIAENLNRLGVPLCLAVGAAFDFLSGRIPRAPEFMRKRGLEWLYRLWCEPRRLWKRYLLGNLIFFMLLLKERFRLKLSA
jgi:N-acetylglucosaminyldiphosphoundecaprenol N-acetyl-beta-D-mannosaminyltransferase